MQLVEGWLCNVQLKVDELQVSHVPPAPEWARHKRSILEHTAFRQNEFIRGSLGDELSIGGVRSKKESDDIIAKLLMYDNGDIRSSSFVHHEVGCCPGGIQDPRNSNTIGEQLSHHREPDQGTERRE
jgi:hypothetical protein